jgi:hypothetical protein
MNILIIAKSVMLVLLLLFERVVGLPIVSSYLFFSFVDALIFWKKIMFVVVYSIVLSSFYGLHLLYVFLFLMIESMMLSLGFFRKQRLARIAMVSCSSLVFFWFLGVSLTTGILVYAVLQTGVLVLSQYKQIQYKRIQYKSLSR